MESPEKPARRPSPLAVPLLVVLGLGLLYGGVSGAVQGAKELELHFESRTWTPVDATLLDVKMDVEHSPKGSRRTLTARYEYQVDGLRYTGTRVSVDIGATNRAMAESWFQELEEKRVTGKPKQALVKPTDPSSSLLYGEVGMDSGIALVVGIVFALMGWSLLYIAAGILRERRKDPSPAPA